MLSGRFLAVSLVFLLIVMSAGQALADSVTLTVKPGQSTNVSVELLAGDSVDYSFTASSWRGADEIGFTIVSSSGYVVFDAGRVKQYTGSYTAISAGTYYLTFDNSFSLITSKTVSANYSVTPAAVNILTRDRTILLPLVFGASSE